MIKVYRAPVIPLLFSAAMLFCACGDSDQIKKLKLRAPAGQEESGAGAADHRRAPLRISIAAMLSPRSSFETYAELVQYLGKRLDMPVEISFRKNYAETNDSLRNSESDMAFVCTGAYIAAKRVFPPDILAVPVVNGKTTYNSYLVVRKDSPAREFGDLKGKTFALMDELSLTGNLYAKIKLSETGRNPSGFFGGIFFSDSHDNSIKAVSEGFADAACVNGLVYQAMPGRGDPYAKKLKILEKSPAFGIPPVVARHGLGAGVKAGIRAVLLGMHKDKEGARILAAMDVERFAAPAPGLYSSVEELLKK